MDASPTGSSPPETHPAATGISCYNPHLMQHPLNTSSTRRNTLKEAIETDLRMLEADHELLREVQMNATGADIHIVSQVAGFYKHFATESKSALIRMRRRGSGEEDVESFLWNFKCRRDFEDRLRQLAADQRANKVRELRATG